MKDVVTLYAQPYDPARPTVCFDEQPVQLLADARSPRPLQPGYPRRRDYEYVRCGTRNLFLLIEPKVGHMRVLVTRRRTKEDFAKAMRYLVDEMYPQVPVIDVVLDQLNTHVPETLIEIFGKAEADRLLAHLVFHYTPLHASWLNIVTKSTATTSWRFWRYCTGTTTQFTPKSPLWLAISTMFWR